MSVAITIAVAVVPAAAAMAPSPPPPPPTRRTVAWSACARLAGTAMICVSIASMWLLLWGWAISEIVRFTCGPTCAVVTAAAFKVVKVAWVTFMVVFPSSALVLKMARARAAAVVPVPPAAAAAATSVEPTKEPALRSSDLAKRVRDLLRDPVALGVLASFSSFLLMVIASLAIGDTTVLVSRRQRVYAVIYCVGALGMNSVNCFILCPLLTVRIWRTWRRALCAL